MKSFFFLITFLVSYMALSQNNYIVTTEDGRRVLLKADYTWEYIDAAEQPIAEAEEKSKRCNLPADFKEPKLNNKIQNQLKRGRATIKHVKQKVAKDYDCNVEDVILLSVTEQRAKGEYSFCANGEKVSYKRVGHSIIEKGSFF